MPYIPLINPAQDGTTRGIEPAVHLSKFNTLSASNKNIVSLSNSPIRLAGCLGCTINIANSSNRVCSSGLAKITSCCLPLRQPEPTAYSANFLPRQCAKNESAIDRAPHALSQLKPESIVQFGKHSALGLPNTTISPATANRNPLEINSHKRLKAWEVLLKEYEEFSFVEQNKIYNHIIEQLINLAPEETQRLVELLEELILNKSYECPTSHHMEEMYMAVFKNLEKKL